MSKEDITRTAKQYSMLKTLPVTTGSAKDPAYLLTSSCTDPKRRTGPACAKARKQV